MAGNLFDNPMMSMMYQDALQSLYNGAVMPWDLEILAVAPLPKFATCISKRTPKK